MPTTRHRADLAKLTDAMLRAAAAAGADSASALAIDNRAVTVDVRAGALEKAERAESLEIGLRVLLGQRQACIVGSDTRSETLAVLAERAVAMAREAPSDPWAGLATADQLSPLRDTAQLDLLDPSGEPDPEALEDAARRAEAAALAVAGVSRVSSASAQCVTEIVQLATSNGFSGQMASGIHALSCVAISGDGTAMERDYCGEGRVYHADLPSPEEVGRIAGERTAARAGPRRPKTGAYPVLYDERAASSLILHLVNAINGSAIARGASWLRDAMGQMVLPQGLDLVDNPLLPRRMSSRAFDGEGLPTRATTLVGDGRLQSWVLDLATARQLGLSSTASAKFEPSGPPSPAPSNLVLTQGTQDRAALLREMGTGLLVTSLIGSTINSTTGDYSRGASGFWVENGEIAYPVNECTIAGNLRDMLGRIIPANDARPHARMQVPSLLVEGMTVAGE